VGELFQQAARRHAVTNYHQSLHYYIALAVFRPGRPV
jgi:hypothetical protein